MNKIKMIDTQYGKMYIEIGAYEVGKRIAIRLYKNNGEFFDDLTINQLELPLKKGEVFLSYLVDNELLDCLKKEGIIKKDLGELKYNMGHNRKVKLDLEKLKEYDLLGYNEYLGKYKPFNVMRTIDFNFLSLSYEKFCYNWSKGRKNNDSKYGDGYCYENLFSNYLQENYPSLNDKLQYDSENGMFCVYCEDENVIDEVAEILSDLYKDKKLMNALIKDIKQFSDYEFEIRI